MKLVFTSTRARQGALGLILILFGLFIGLVLWLQQQSLVAEEALMKQQQVTFAEMLPRYEALNMKIDAAQAQGLDVAYVLSQRTMILLYIQSGEVTKADEAISSAIFALDNLLAAKAAADAALAAQPTPTPSPTPTMVATPKATPKPTATPTVTSSTNTAYTRYELKTIATSAGTFTIHVITADLGPGKARLITDTANDSDCLDNCPTLSLASYVSRNGGVAGINGTYFCPADYSWCAGQVNTFLYRIFTTRLAKVINADNNATEPDPVLVYTTGGTPRYFARWDDYKAAGLSTYAAINSGPALVSGGQIVVNVSKLDDKQRYTKSNRGALGLKGATLLAVIGKSATVVDMAYVMQALGADYAMNLDGGGSSGMYYTGAYKVGPGRSLPNAVIIGE